MKAQKIRVALLFGGRSAEHEVSLISAKSIYSNLDKRKYEIDSIYINKNGDWRIVESPLLAPSELQQGSFVSFLPWGKKNLLQTIEADIYFPILHGPYGEDGTIQGLLDLADAPYVGAAVLASSVGMDKAIAKTLFHSSNLPTVNYHIILEADWNKNKNTVLERIKDSFALPFFVKPANLGSSVGITKVKDYAQTEASLNAAFLYDQKILIEEGILGRELECSVLGNDNPKASLPGEIIPYREFYDYKDKYIEGKTSFQIPAKLSPPESKEIQRLSIEAFKVIDCSGMARVDFFLQEKTDKIFLNEINTIPGFTEISMYPKLWEISGLPFPQLLDELIHLAFEKHKRIKSKQKDWSGEKP